MEEEINKKAIAMLRTYEWITGKSTGDKEEMVLDAFQRFLKADIKVKNNLNAESKKDLKN